MIWLYDKAIADDLTKAFNSSVKVIAAESSLAVAAQLTNDEIGLPLVSVTRRTDAKIDTTRTNFTRAHFGVPAAFDNKTNTIYNERALPVSLSYNITVLTSNSIDRDEIAKEIIMRYIHMYYLSISLPYECKRQVNFGVVVNQDGLENSSSTYEYLQTGKLYQQVIPIDCEGCVMISYTPHHLTRTTLEEPKIEN